MITLRLVQLLYKRFRVRKPLELLHAVLGLLGDASSLVDGGAKLAGHVVVSGQAVQEEAGKTNTRVGPALGTGGHTGVGEDGLKDHDENGTEGGGQQPEGGRNSTELTTGLNVGELDTGRGAKSLTQGQDEPLRELQPGRVTVLAVGAIPINGVRQRTTGVRQVSLLDHGSQTGRDGERNDN